MGAALRRRYGHAKDERPIDSKAFHRNEKRVGPDEWPCARCGKPVKEADAKNWVTFTSGGGRFLRTDDPPVPANDPGQMGWHPVGPDCAKRLKKSGVRIEPEAR